MSFGKVRPGDHAIVAEGFISRGAWSLIEDKFSDFAKAKLTDVVRFTLDEVLPAAELYEAQISKDPATRWKQVPPVIEELKNKAKAKGLWNLFLSKKHYPKHGTPLTNLEYAVMAEITGRGGHFGSEAFNCSAPDTGNMEVLAKYGNEEQQKKWLMPLLNGEIRSAFAMTERFIASSDATNIRTDIRQEGNEIVINGHKWWISGAGDPRCKLHILMGKSDAQNANQHRQQSIVLIPADTPGIKVVRPMQVFGYDDAPEGHCEVIYENVRVPLANLVKGWGAGFEIIQGRLGPGRIHHCMRSIGAAEAALDRMLTRVTDTRKRTFGKALYEHGTIVADIARSRMQIDQARLLVLSAASMIDKSDAKGAMRDIGMSKVVVPTAALEVIDRAMQAHGAEGISQDTPLAAAYAGLRTLRYADGPDEVHIQQIGKQELRRAEALWERQNRITGESEKKLKAAGIRSHL
ncbi:acyl-CoA dehydrogenase NM domain-like protein [Jaminaea rosea]|uniref:Acyl-CoA dehydrogenase NM domain-like protein n=1 Tax=Jaminaea rosea TaxID=1569628 RepID=A0A316UWQ7_9BASI|nr:acyl-CoA dehydrogenase NM domain-like protein [Jaminaea rosea]PWN29740.1 acyl-CoA dehydrogenase NM domain-like protein [Jaminaea rosea]